MKYYKRKAIRLLPLIVLSLSLAMIATRAKSAAEFPSPCKEDAYMANLRPQPVSPAPQKVVTRNLAIFIFDGVQIIDYTGPFEVLGQARDNGTKLFNVYTVAEKPGPITTNMGMTVVPKYSFADMPKTDVLVLPGGNTQPGLDNPKVIKWVQDTAGNAEFVMSVCNGAFYLGKAGLLDGLSATTYYGLIDELKEVAPKAHVVTDQRFVDNGKIITTAGLSSGIDGALHLIEKIVGRGRAQEVALNLEYNWQPDVAYARASLADMHLLRVIGREGFKFPEGTGLTVLGQRGGKDNWERNWQVRLNGTAPELMKIVDAKLAEGWTRVSGTAERSGARTVWKFLDEDRKEWNAVAAVEPTSGVSNSLNLRITLSRSESAAR
ncbi:MAG TPA: DJ-1/PfpI family protein [Pyrinomonadaceae bacterium]|jgi:putative intracellular protease/amidase|nr:DJ-1/PfpI family protein [Pyrinomonadaceae bacterium]